MSYKDWYEKHIEEPIRPLVKLLRDNGFNTIASCGHLPQPYIQIEWYDEKEDIRRLYELLIDNDYKNFTIKAYWFNLPVQNNKLIELTFYCGLSSDTEFPEPKLADESMFHDKGEDRNH